MIMVREKKENILRITLSEFEKQSARIINKQDVRSIFSNCFSVVQLHQNVSTSMD